MQYTVHKCESTVINSFHDTKKMRRRKIYLLTAAEVLIMRLTTVLVISSISSVLAFRDKHVQNRRHARAEENRRYRLRRHDQLREKENVHLSSDGGAIRKNESREAHSDREKAANRGIGEGEVFTDDDDDDFTYFD